MRYIGKPVGMWLLFAGSFEKNLMTVLGYDTIMSISIKTKAKSTYREIIKRLPNFEKKDHFKTSIIECAMLAAFLLNMTDRPSLDETTQYFQSSIMTKVTKLFCRMNGRKKFTDNYIANIKSTAAFRAGDRNPYSWNMLFLPYADGSGYETRFTKCGICLLMKELGLYELTPAICRLDYARNQEDGTGVLIRRYTLATGGPYCDCGYKMRFGMEEP